MDLNVLLEDLRTAAENLQKNPSCRKSLSTAYCHKVIKVLEKVSNWNSEYDNFITGLWVISAHFTETLDLLIQVASFKDATTRLFRECTKAVLNIQWQNLEEDSDVRQRFVVSLSNLNAKLVPLNYHRFRLLEALLENPWTDPTLAKIMGGEAEDEEEKEEVRSYIAREDAIILQLRVDMMLKENCEEYALNLCNSCLLHPELKRDLALRKTQLSLLHKLGLSDKLQEECQNLSVQEAVCVIRQLQTRNTKEICTVLAQNFMVQHWIRQKDHKANKELLKLWIRQQALADKDRDRFKESVWAIAKLSQSTEQILFFIDILREQLGSTYLQLYVDMCIFAINVDKGQMEKSQREGQTDVATARKEDMAAICGKLACLNHRASIKVARICVLTAFVLKPSFQMFQSIAKFYTTDFVCCGTCAKSSNSDKGTVNPATLYEVERLLNMLRPEFLNPDNTVANIKLLCERFCKENGLTISLNPPLPPSVAEDKNAPLRMVTVEAFGKVKTTSTKPSNVFESVSPHAQAMLRDKLHSVQSSQPRLPSNNNNKPQTFQAPPAQHSRPNIIQSRPRHPSPTAVLQAKGSAGMLEPFKNRQPSLNLNSPRQQLISPSSSSNASSSSLGKGRQVPSQLKNPTKLNPQLIQYIQSAVRQNSSVLQELIKHPNKEIVRTVMNMLNQAGKSGSGATKSQQQQQQQQQNPATLLLSDQKGLPTVSTLIKPPTTGAVQGHQSVMQPSSTHVGHPSSSSLSASSLLSTAAAACYHQPTKPYSHHTTSQSRASSGSTFQKAESFKMAKAQAANIRSLMQTSMSQQKQQVLAKQMAGSTITLNPSPATYAFVRPANSSPYQNIQHHPSQSLTQPHQTSNIINNSAFSSQNTPLSYSNTLQQQQSIAPSNPVTQNPPALSSDELSGSIMGIDDTIISELLQDSGIFSNTFPDIEVDFNLDDLDKKKESRTVTVSSNPQNTNQFDSSNNRTGFPSQQLQSSNASSSFSNRNISQNQPLAFGMKNNSPFVKSSQHYHKSDSSPMSSSTIVNMASNLIVNNANIDQQRSSIDVKPLLNSKLSLSMKPLQPLPQMSVEQIREVMKQEQIEGEVTMDSSNNATYRCIICSLAFQVLEELREHVRNVCKPGLQSSSVYNTKIKQDHAKSAKAGLETTTVFQCLRCFELCISQEGIKQHRLTCKRVPTVPQDIKNATSNSKTSKTPPTNRSPSTSRSNTPKMSVPQSQTKATVTDTKPIIKDNSSKIPEMPLPFPYPSLNTKEVLSSLQATAGDNDRAKQNTGDNDKAKQSVTLVKRNSNASVPQTDSPAKSVESKIRIDSPAIITTTVKKEEKKQVPSNAGIKEEVKQVASNAGIHEVKQVASNAGIHEVKQVVSNSGINEVKQVTSNSGINEMKPVASNALKIQEVKQVASNAMKIQDTEHVAPNTGTKEEVKKEEEKKKVCEKPEKVVPPLTSSNYSEISGSGGSKFYRCKKCSQTLCSYNSLLSHWNECATKQATFPYGGQQFPLDQDEELEPGEIRPLFGKVLQNVLDVIADVANGKTGTVPDVDSDTEDLDFLLSLESQNEIDSCKMPQGKISMKEFPTQSFLNYNSSSNVTNRKISCLPMKDTVGKDEVKEKIGVKNLIRAASVNAASKINNSLRNLDDEESIDSDRDDAHSNYSDDMETSSLVDHRETRPNLRDRARLKSLQSSTKEPPPKLRDRTRLKPVQSFVNESFISQFTRSSLHKNSSDPKSNNKNKVEENVKEEKDKNTEKGNFKCIVCSKICNSKRILIQHYAGKHLQPYTMKTLTDGSSYFCYLCQKSFSTFMHYMHHIPNHGSIIMKKMTSQYSSLTLKKKHWSSRIAASRGFTIASGVKNGGISPKRAKALISKRKAAKSARERMKKVLTKMAAKSSSLALNGDIKPKSMNKIERRGRPKKESGSNAKQTLQEKLLKSKIENKRLKLSDAIPLSENEDSCASSSPYVSDVSDEDEYKESGDTDSDSTINEPPQTRNRSRNTRNSTVESNRQGLVKISPSSLALHPELAKMSNVLPTVSVHRLTQSELEKFVNSNKNEIVSNERPLSESETKEKVPKSTCDLSKPEDSGAQKQDIAQKLKEMPKSLENAHKTVESTPKAEENVKPLPPMANFQSSFESYIKQKKDGMPNWRKKANFKMSKNKFENRNPLSDQTSITREISDEKSEINNESISVVASDEQGNQTSSTREISDEKSEINNESISVVASDEQGNQTSSTREISDEKSEINNESISVVASDEQGNQTSSTREISDEKSEINNESISVVASDEQGNSNMKGSIVIADGDDEKDGSKDLALKEKEIISSVRKRRCSVNLGPKIDDVEINKTTETNSKEVEERSDHDDCKLILSSPSSRKKSIHNKEEPMKDQTQMPLLPQCDVVLERNESVETNLSSLGKNVRISSDEECEVMIGSDISRKSKSSCEENKAKIKSPIFSPFESKGETKSSNKAFRVGRKKRHYLKTNAEDDLELNTGKNIVVNEKKKWISENVDVKKQVTSSKAVGEIKSDGRNIVEAQTNIEASEANVKNDHVEGNRQTKISAKTIANVREGGVSSGTISNIETNKQEMNQEDVEESNKDQISEDVEMNKNDGISSDNVEVNRDSDLVDVEFSYEDKAIMKNEKDEFRSEDNVEVISEDGVNIEVGKADVEIIKDTCSVDAEGGNVKIACGETICIDDDEDDDNNDKIVCLEDIKLNSEKGAIGDRVHTKEDDSEDVILINEKTSVCGDAVVTCEDTITNDIKVNTDCRLFPEVVKVSTETVCLDVEVTPEELCSKDVEIITDKSVLKEVKESTDKLRSDVEVSKDESCSKDVEGIKINSTFDENLTERKMQELRNSEVVVDAYSKDRICSEVTGEIIHETVTVDDGAFSKTDHENELSKQNCSDMEVEQVDVNSANIYNDVKDNVKKNDVLGNSVILLNETESEAAFGHCKESLRQFDYDGQETQKDLIAVSLPQTSSISNLPQASTENCKAGENIDVINVDDDTVSKDSEVIEEEGVLPYRGEMRRDGENLLVGVEQVEAIFSENVMINANEYSDVEAHKQNTTSSEDQDMQRTDDTFIKEVKLNEKDGIYLEDSQETKDDVEETDEDLKDIHVNTEDREHISANEEDEKHIQEDEEDEKQIQTNEENKKHIQGNKESKKKLHMNEKDEGNTEVDEEEKKNIQMNEEDEKHIQMNEEDEKHIQMNDEEEKHIQVDEEVEKLIQANEEEKHIQANEEEKHIQMNEEEGKHNQANEEEKHIQMKEENEKHIQMTEEDEDNIQVDEEVEKHIQMNEEDEKHIQMNDEKHIQANEAEKYSQTKEENEKHIQTKEENEKHIQVNEEDEKHIQVDEEGEKHIQLDKEDEKHIQMNDEEEKHIQPNEEEKHIQLDEEVEKHIQANEEEKHIQVDEEVEKHIQANEEEKHIQMNEEEGKHNQANEEEKHVQMNEEDEKHIRMNQEDEKHIQMKEENEKHIQMNEEDEKHIQMNEEDEKHIQMNDENEKHIRANEAEKYIQTKEENEKHIQTKEENEKHIQVNEEDEKHIQVDEEGEKHIQIDEEDGKHIQMEEEDQKHIQVDEENEKHIQVDEEDEKHIQMNNEEEKHIQADEEGNKHIKVNEEDEKHIQMHDKADEDDKKHMKVDEEDEKHIQVNKVVEEHIQANEAIEEHIQANEAVEEHIQANEVVEEHIQANEAVEEHIQANEAVEEHIQANEAVEEHIQANEVVEEDIQVKEVVEEHIQANEAIEEHIQANEAVEEHIQVNEVVEEHIQANKAVEEHIQANEAVEEHIQANEAVEEHIQANEVVEEDIQVNEVVEEHIQANEVVEEDIQTNEAVEEHIQVNEVVEEHIHANEAVEEHIQANEAVEEHIQANEVVEEDIQVNEVVEEHIQANEAVEEHIQANEVVEEHIQVNEEVEEYIQAIEAVEEHIQVNEEVEEYIQANEEDENYIHLVEEEEKCSDCPVKNEALSEDVAYSEDLSEGVEVNREDVAISKNYMNEENKESTHEDVENVQLNKEYKTCLTSPDEDEAVALSEDVNVNLEDKDDADTESSGMLSDGGCAQMVSDLMHDMAQKECQANVEMKEDEIWTGCIEEKNEEEMNSQEINIVNGEELDLKGDIEEEGKGELEEETSKHVEAIQATVQVTEENKACSNSVLENEALAEGVVTSEDVLNSECLEINRGTDVAQNHVIKDGKKDGTFSEYSQETIMHVETNDEYVEKIQVTKADKTCSNSPGKDVDVTFSKDVNPNCEDKDDLHSDSRRLSDDSKKEEDGECAQTGICNKSEMSFNDIEENKMEDMFFNDAEEWKENQKISVEVEMKEDGGGLCSGGIEEMNDDEMISQKTAIDEEKITLESDVKDGELKNVESNEKDITSAEEHGEDGSNANNDQLNENRVETVENVKGIKPTEIDIAGFKDDDASLFVNIDSNAEQNALCDEGDDNFESDVDILDLSYPNQNNLNKEVVSHKKDIAPARYQLSKDMNETVSGDLVCDDDKIEYEMHDKHIERLQTKEDVESFERVGPLETNQGTQSTEDIAIVIYDVNSEEGLTASNENVLTLTVEQKQDDFDVNETENSIIFKENMDSLNNIESETQMCDERVVNVGSDSEQQACQYGSEDVNINDRGKVIDKEKETTDVNGEMTPAKVQFEQEKEGSSTAESEKDCVKHEEEICEEMTLGSVSVQEEGGLFKTNIEGKADNVEGNLRGLNDMLSEKCEYERDPISTAESSIEDNKSNRSEDIAESDLHNEVGNSFNNSCEDISSIVSIRGSNKKGCQTRNSPKLLRTRRRVYYGYNVHPPSNEHEKNEKSKNSDKNLKKKLTMNDKTLKSTESEVGNETINKCHGSVKNEEIQGLNQNAIQICDVPSILGLGTESDSSERKLDQGVESEKSRLDQEVTVALESNENDYVGAEETKDDDTREVMHSGSSNGSDVESNGLEDKNRKEDRAKECFESQDNAVIGEEQSNKERSEELNRMETVDFEDLEVSKIDNLLVKSGLDSQVNQDILTQKHIKNDAGDLSVKNKESKPLDVGGSKKTCNQTTSDNGISAMELKARSDIKEIVMRKREEAFLNKSMRKERMKVAIESEALEFRDQEVKTDAIEGGEKSEELEKAKKSEETGEFETEDGGNKCRVSSLNESLPQEMLKAYDENEGLELSSQRENSAVEGDEKHEILEKVKEGEEETGELEKEEGRKKRKMNVKSSSSSGVEEDDLSDYSLVIEEDKSSHKCFPDPFGFSSKKRSHPDDFGFSSKKRPRKHSLSLKSVDEDENFLDTHKADKEIVSVCTEEKEVVHQKITAEPETISKVCDDIRESSGENIMQTEKKTVANSKKMTWLQRKREAFIEKKREESMPFTWDLEEHPQYSQELEKGKEDGNASTTSNSALHLEFDGEHERLENVTHASSSCETEEMSVPKSDPMEKKGKKVSSSSSQESIHSEDIVKRSSRKRMISPSQTLAKVRKKLITITKSPIGSAVASPNSQNPVTSTPKKRGRPKKVSLESSCNKATNVSVGPSSLEEQSKENPHFINIDDDEISFNTRSLSPSFASESISEVLNSSSAELPKKRGRKPKKRLYEESESCLQQIVVKPKRAISSIETSPSPMKKPDITDPKLKKAGLIPVSKTPVTTILPVTRRDIASSSSVSLTTSAISDTNRQNVNTQQKCGKDTIPSPLLSSLPAQTKKYNKHSIVSEQFSPMSSSSNASFNQSSLGLKTTSPVLGTKKPSTIPETSSISKNDQNKTTNNMDTNETTAAVVKRRTPTTIRKHFDFQNSIKRKQKQSTTQTTVYRVDPLPKSTFKTTIPSGQSEKDRTLHTVLPPGVTHVIPKKTQQQSNAKWKIDKEKKTTKMKAKQRSSPMSFKRT